MKRIPALRRWSWTRLWRFTPLVEQLEAREHPTDTGLLRPNVLPPWLERLVDLT
jgi:hypothetical protein